MFIFIQRIFQKIKPTLPAIIIFLLLLVPFVGSVPYLDGDTEFQIAVNFYEGKYLSNWMPYHPPLKLFITAFIFRLFGLYAYSLVGILFGILGIISLYVITKTLFDKKTAILAIIFLSLSGLYVSTALFSVNDFLLTVFLLISFALYVRKKYIWSVIFACFVVFSKESGIIYPVSIIVVEALQKRFRIENILPFFCLAFWIFFLHLTGHALWNSWNFSTTAQQGSFFTLFNNIITLKIFNAYAYENWLHLFIFNYNWVFWIAACAALFYIKWNRYLSILAVFGLLYSFLILSFQTYSITRYVLPILPFVYMLDAALVYKVKYKLFLILLLCITFLTSLFTSTDPISNRIWSKQQLLSQSFYLNKTIDGNDGITYNMQFLYLTKQRSQIIHSGNCKSIAFLLISEDTLKALHIPQCL